MNVDVNYVSVLFAALASFVIGFLWYSPLLFAKPWVKAMGSTMESMKKKQAQMGPMYALSFVASLVTAYVLFHVMVFSGSYIRTDALTTGLTSAFWMWLGFVMPVQLTDVIFGGKKWMLFVINTGYQLASLLGMGVVLGLLM